MDIFSQIGRQTELPEPLDTEPLDTLYKKLEGSMEVFEPDDDKKRPALLLFHGCDGKRPFLNVYAQLAATMGVRVFIIDSLAPRQWNRRFAKREICTGQTFRGNERAWDVLAAIKGVSERANVDAHNIMLGGWSHGGWAIAELMNYKLTSEQDTLRARIKGLFLVYPFLTSFPITHQTPWEHRPLTTIVAAKQDHLTPFPLMEFIAKQLKEEGTEIEFVPVDGTHAFDEAPINLRARPSSRSLMHFDQPSFDTSVEALQAMIEKLWDVRSGLTPSANIRHTVPSASL